MAHNCSFVGGGIVDGRGYKIYEAPTELRMVSVYVFVADIEESMRSVQ